MSFFTIIAILVYVSIALFARMQNLTDQKPIQPEVMGEQQQTFTTPSPTLVPSSSPTIAPSSQTKSTINIDVDNQIDKTAPGLEQIVYPGATLVKQENNLRVYETNDPADSVYNWYFTELKNRQFQIRNNVKTRANDKFKAVLQGVSDNLSIKITIDQENSSAKTVIVLE